MRTLEYKNPFKIYSTEISNAFSLDRPTKLHYCRALSITTKYGFVNALDFKWPHNKGVDSWTQFEVVIDGYKYYATIDESKLSDRQLKWLATNFIKTVLKTIDQEVREFDLTQLDKIN